MPNVPASSGDVQPPPAVDQLEYALFGPPAPNNLLQVDEANVLDAWRHWQTRIGKTNVQQIKNGHVMLDNVANLIRTHR